MFLEKPDINLSLGIALGPCLDWIGHVETVAAKVSNIFIRRNLDNGGGMYF